jgi:predicted translin family RNA/ssDNA-binding protein
VPLGAALLLLNRIIAKMKHEDAGAAQVAMLEATCAEVTAVLSAQDETRDRIRGVRDVAEVEVRRVVRALAGLHLAPCMKTAATAAMETVSACGKALKDVENACPDEPGAFFQYHDIWRNVLQQSAYACVLLEFVVTDGLASKDRVVEMLGAAVRLPLEDYLWAVCQAVSDLPRMAMNRVTLGDYATPRRNAQFAANVFDAFLQCNFRNDFLRKKFDGMKYEVKKLEELIYDLSVRGLLKKEDDDASVMKEDATMN